MKRMKAFNFILTISLVMNFTMAEGQGSSVVNIAPDTLGQLLVNQIGYQPNATKIALMRIKTEQFEVVDVTSGTIVFTGKPGPFQYWNLSGDSVCSADFSAVKKPGKYQICLNNKQLCSYVFEIGSNVYSSITSASLKSFYLTRSGMEITKEFGGIWARAAGHPDTEVLVHTSAATDKRPEGFKISSPGGWYDAGDYNKYIVNSSISTYTLLLFCQMYPGYCKNLTVHIPESGNGISDVLNELLYNLRWMLTMQDPNDGGVYHKLTNKKFSGFIMPEKATDPRYVVYKSTAASLDFAATMAMASRVFVLSESAELSRLGKTCLAAAEKAYAWAKANPAIYFKNPADISTGEYGDKEVTDEFFWAASELALAKNDGSMIVKNELESQRVGVQSWDATAMLGFISLSLCNEPKVADFSKAAQNKLLAYAGQLVDKSIKAPYKISLDFFKWGSNSDVSNMAIIKLVAYKISGDKKYLESIQGDVDYLLGRNATGYCFVTGFGGKQVMNIHHRLSAADEIAGPYPGLLSGGPNTVTFADCPDITRSKFPAKSFVDVECSYSTNEIAINWNAPLAYLFNALAASVK